MNATFSKKIFFSFFTAFTFYFSYSQNYSSKNITLKGHIHPNTDTAGLSVAGRKYTGCWGWHQADKNREYAIVGGSTGTYFIDITNPETPDVSAFVPGKERSNWREIKTYNNFCYIVSDDNPPNRFQIVDMSFLPDSVRVIHDGTAYLEKGHTLSIDGDKMYVALPYGSGLSSAMSVFSLSNPTAPVLLRSIEQDYPFINYVHDMYVRNDTIFVSCGHNGMYILKYMEAANTFSLLGSYVNYPGMSANHSSCLTGNGKYLVFTDETPGSPIKMVNVQDLANIQPVQTFIPYPDAMPHNPYVVGNNFVVVSCYQDGIQIYDISDPAEPVLSGFFDTYPQGGFNVSDYYGDYFKGNWGAYPYLPSGIIIASDMQNGIFLLDAGEALKKQITADPTSCYPNPASGKIFISGSQGFSFLQIKNMMGETVLEKSFQGSSTASLDISALENGTYFIWFIENDKPGVKKLVISH